MFKKTLKLFLEIGLVAGLITLALNIPVAIAGYLYLPNGTNYNNIPAPDTTLSGQQMAVKFMQGVVNYMKVLTGIAGVGFIIYSGAKMVTAGGDEEAIKKGTKGLMYCILAFAIVALSEEVGNIVGFFKPGTETSTGGILKSPNEILSRVHLFDKQVEILITFIKYMIGSLAALMVVINGSRLVVGGGEEENTKKAKNGIIYALAGLVLLIVGNTFINSVFYIVDKNVYSGIEGVEPALNLQKGVSEIIGITNLVVTFVGPLLLLLLLVGGVMYITSAGEEESMNKAKRLITAALIGVIVIYGAFAIVSTIVSGSFTPPTTNV